MLNIIISLLTFVLILISLFMVLVILMQRADTNAGMGSAFGGGVAESAFGADTSNVLIKATKWSAAAFFVISLILFLLHLNKANQDLKATGDELPDIPVVRQTVTEPAPAATDTSSVNISDDGTSEAVDAAVDAFGTESTTEDSETQNPNP